jgi:suppressor of G2 allele of SKP1
VREGVSEGGREWWGIGFLSLLSLSSLWIDGWMNLPSSFFSFLIPLFFFADMTPRSLGIVIKTSSTGSEYQLDIDLFEAIDTEASKMTIMGTKIELTLKKQKEGQWEGLERHAGQAKLSAMVEDAPDSRPSAYSTKKDWDSIDRAAQKEADEEKPEGEAALNKLFSDIYGNASDETKRAMMKSFQTSGGTVLSTNWDEVEKKDYEADGIKGPDGMEWKKY